MIALTDPRYSWTRQQMLVEIERQEEEILKLTALIDLETEEFKLKKLNNKRLLKAQMLLAKISAST